MRISKRAVDIIRPAFVNQLNKTLKAMKAKLINGITINIQKIIEAENTNKEENITKSKIYPGNSDKQQRIIDFATTISIILY